MPFTISAKHPQRKEKVKVDAFKGIGSSNLEPVIQPEQLSLLEATAAQGWLILPKKLQCIEQGHLFSGGGGAVIGFSILQLSCFFSQLHCGNGFQNDFYHMRSLHFSSSSSEKVFEWVVRGAY